MVGILNISVLVFTIPLSLRWGGHHRHATSPPSGSSDLGQLPFHIAHWVGSFSGIARETMPCKRPIRISPDHHGHTHHRCNAGSRARHRIIWRTHARTNARTAVRNQQWILNLNVLLLPAAAMSHKITRGRQCSRYKLIMRISIC